MIDFKLDGHLRYFHICRSFIFGINIHREAHKTTSPGRCDPSEPSLSFQVAALISRVAKNCRPKGAPEYKAALVYSPYLKEKRGGDRRDDQDFLVRDNGTSTFACRGSCLLPSGQSSLSLSFSLLERASRHNCAAESFLRSFFEMSQKRIFFTEKYCGTPPIAESWTKKKPNNGTDSFFKRFKP